MINEWDLLKIKAEEFNVRLDELQMGQLKEYWKYLYEYNKHTNIVSSAELDTVALKHFADSLSIGLVSDEIGLTEKKTVIDIGAGGGFPGIPIIIAFPLLKLCAVDSVRKKTDFISKLADILAINDRIEIINTRAEELANDRAKREKFDISVTRAVSKLNVILEYNLPFVKTGGYFVAYKAKTYKDEISQSSNALSELGGEIIKTVSYTLHDEERNLILIKKTLPTPMKYPRKTGVPSKMPL